MSVESYTRSMEIENFLRYTLNLKRGSAQDRKLKGAYEGIVHYENGLHLLKPREFRNEFDSLRKKFVRALEKITNTTYSAKVGDLRLQISIAADSEDIWNIFCQLRSLKQDSN